MFFLTHDPVALASTGHMSTKPVAQGRKAFLLACYPLEGITLVPCQAFIGHLSLTVPKPNIIILPLSVQCFSLPSKDGVHLDQWFPNVRTLTSASCKKVFVGPRQNNNNSNNNVNFFHKDILIKSKSFPLF